MTRRLRPGWMVALFAAVLSGSTWLPWLSTSAHGWASAVGGTHGNLDLPPGFGAGQLIVLLSATLLAAGAMVGRGLSVKAACPAALIISLLIVGLIVWYYKLNVSSSVSAAYGLYLGAVAAGCAVACSIWALITAASGR